MAVGILCSGNNQVVSMQAPVVFESGKNSFAGTKGENSPSAIEANAVLQKRFGESYQRTSMLQNL
jgi:hypothetical protein